MPERLPGGSGVGAGSGASAPGAGGGGQAQSAGELTAGPGPKQPTPFGLLGSSAPSNSSPFQLQVWAGLPAPGPVRSQRNCERQVRPEEREIVQHM